MAIEFDGEFTVATPRDEAWRVLSDVDRFAPLLPTYLSHETRDDGSADVRIRIGVGKIRGTAVVNLALVARRAPESARYAGNGKIMGGAFELGAAFDLDAPGPRETTVRWRGDLTILGKLVSLAGGLVRPVAGKQIDNLVDAIRAALESGSAAAPAAPKSTTAKT